MADKKQKPTEKPKTSKKVFNPDEYPVPQKPRPGKKMPKAERKF